MAQDLHLPVRDRGHAPPAQPAASRTRPTANNRPADHDCAGGLPRGGWLPDRCSTGCRCGRSKRRRSRAPCWSASRSTSAAPRPRPPTRCSTSGLRLRPATSCDRRSPSPTFARFGGVRARPRREPGSRDAPRRSTGRWSTGTLLVLGILITALRGQLEPALKQLAAAARTDSLTRLANRRELEERFAAELERSTRDGRPLSIVVLDLDWFKEFNDRFGHSRRVTARWSCSPRR